MTYPWGPFFRIAILTVQRREEVAAMRWSEIAPNLSVWTMSGARMKNGKPHDVHLSRPAQDRVARPVRPPEQGQPRRQR